MNKVKQIIVILIFVGLTAFNISGTFELNNPSMKINEEDVNIKQVGDMVIYTISLCSSNNLKSFSVSPSVSGLNTDSQLKYVFNGTTKHATINYFYAVPKNYKELKKIKFNFELQDSRSVVVREKEVLFN